MHVFGKEVPQGASSYGEASGAPGPVLDSEW